MLSDVFIVFLTAMFVIVGLTFAIYKFVETRKKVAKAKKEYEDGAKALEWLEQRRREKRTELRANHGKPAVIPQIQPIVKRKAITQPANPVLSRSTAKRLEVQRKTVTSPARRDDDSTAAIIAAGAAAAAVFASTNSHASSSDSCAAPSSDWGGGGGGFDGGGASGSFDD